MTPTRLTALLAAVTLSVATLFDGIDRTIPDRLSNAILVLAAVSWVSYLAATCRDTINTNIEHANRATHAAIDALHADIANYGERRANDGRIDGIRVATETVSDRQLAAVRPGPHAVN